MDSDSDDGEEGYSDAEDLPEEFEVIMFFMRTFMSVYWHCANYLGVSSS